MVRNRILRGLAVLGLVMTGALVGTAQPAAAAPTYQTWKLESTHTVFAGIPKAIAVLNASTGDTAPVIQYAFNKEKPYNDVMMMEFEPGNYVRIKPGHTFSRDGNVHNDKCLAIKNNRAGFNQPIVSATCSYDSVNNDVWRLTREYVVDVGDSYLLRNVQHDTCIVVQNAATNNGANLVTHDCYSGGLNHLWTPAGVVAPEIS